MTACYTLVLVKFEATCLDGAALGIAAALLFGLAGTVVAWRGVGSAIAIRAARAVLAALIGLTLSVAAATAATLAVGHWLDQLAMALFYALLIGLPLSSVLAFCLASLERRTTKA